MKTLLGQLDTIAIGRLKTFEPNAIAKRPEGYYVAYSGGKDSDVILDLARRSGVKYTAHHHLTTCDPPEVVWHVREQPDVVIDRPEMSMWALIHKKGMPPTRKARYCCESQKERKGFDSIVVTGIRWDESHKRAKRRMIETCFRNKSKQFLNLIIDWSTTEVWQYLKTRAIKYCSLYDEGFMRLGCVLCPMNRDVAQHIKRWPKIAAAWEKAVKATFQQGKQWKSPEEYWQWWLDRDAPSCKKDDKQMLFFRD